LRSPTFIGLTAALPLRRYDRAHAKMPHWMHADPPGLQTNPVDWGVRASTRRVVLPVSHGVDHGRPGLLPAFSSGPDGAHDRVGRRGTFRAVPSGPLLVRPRRPDRAKIPLARSSRDRPGRRPQILDPNTGPGARVTSVSPSSSQASTNADHLPPLDPPPPPFATFSRPSTVPASGSPPCLTPAPPPPPARLRLFSLRWRARARG